LDLLLHHLDANTISFVRTAIIFFFILFSVLYILKKKFILWFIVVFLGLLAYTNSFFTLYQTLLLIDIVLFILFIMDKIPNSETGSYDRTPSSGSDLWDFDFDFDGGDSGGD
jgi:hypothetical protein